jgi:hypothetical protein
MEVRGANLHASISTLPSPSAYYLILSVYCHGCCRCNGLPEDPGLEAAARCRKSGWLYDQAIPLLGYKGARE